MSKILFACTRPGLPHDSDELMRRVALGATRIAPDNPNVKPPRILRGSNSIVAVMNPSSTVLFEPGSICLGHVNDKRWNEVGGEKPEGTYAICRSNSRAVELLSDATASRTLWYYMDETILLASTSQRWMATALGGFEADDRVLTWMLAAGSLGPTGGWDRRLNRVQADSMLRVDLETWAGALTTEEATFQGANENVPAVKDGFKRNLLSAIAALDFDFSKWVLPLSGGYDSRAILCMLGRTEGLRAITWGVRASAGDPGSDAVIARRVAKQLGVAHEYFETDVTEGTLSGIFDKFVAYGEGRVTNVSGYLDGFAIWQALLDRGVEGVIRGDEGFGWKSVRTIEEARRSVRLTLWSDFSNLPELEELGLAPQEIPALLRRRETETACQWRDRLYHQYRAPTILAALTDLKAPFVEVANPFMTHSIIKAVRTLPDDLRTNKKLFKDIVHELSPTIPYARTRSIVDQKQVLRSREALEILDDTLRSEAARSIFPASLLNLLLQDIHSTRDQSVSSVVTSLKKRLRRVVPRIPGVAAKADQSLTMDFNEMAFRVFITCKTRELLQEDARGGSNRGEGHGC